VPPELLNDACAMISQVWPAAPILPVLGPLLAEVRCRGNPVTPAADLLRSSSARFTTWRTSWDRPDQLGGGQMESREDCLREAAECDRLAQLANTQGTRTLLAVAAFQWRKLADKAAERQKSQWPFVSEAIRPN
jgi:hypothetical protein